MSLCIEKLQDEFSVCKLSDLSKAALDDDFFFIGKTDEELSLVCRTVCVPENVTDRSDCWKGFRVCGVLDFSLTGVLSGISGVLAEGGIGIFTVSTYNTDYLFVKKENLENALCLLSRAGYRIVE